jgi:glycyl-tRNA synthetase
VVLRFLPALAPIKAAILPLVKKDGLPEIAERIFHDLKGRFNVFYDDGGSIGRRYRRQDEVGTPFCITVDYQTKDDRTVTVRFRDSMQQVRVKMDDIPATLRASIKDYRRADGASEAQPAPGAEGRAG